MSLPDADGHPDRNELHGSRWRMHHASGLTIIERLLFLDGGLVWSNGDIACLWELGSDGLLIRTIDGQPSILFPGREAVGRALVGGKTGGGDRALDLRLSPISETSTSDPSRNLHCSIVLGGASDTLLVLLNSINRPFDGKDTRWEFHALPHRLGIDHVRLAERADPPCWYVDKTVRIGRLLDGVVRQGTRQVIFCGLSSGGYGSLLFAEILGRAHPNIEVRSVTINPQTVHAAAHRRFMQSLPADMPPALISDASLARRDCPETEIDVLARARGQRGNVAHTIFYDSGNPAETYYVDRIRTLRGFDLRPFMFGVGHMSGCIALFERHLVQDEVEALVSRVRGRPAPSGKAA